MTSTVLVGGFKPEDIQQEHFRKKAEAEARDRAGSLADRLTSSTPPPGSTSTTTEATPHDINGCSSRFGIIDCGDYYNIQGVRYRGLLYAVDLSKKMLENGNRFDYGQLIKSSVTRIEQKSPVNGYHACSAPFLLHLMCSIQDAAPAPFAPGAFGELRNHFRQAFQSDFVITLTLVSYLDDQTNHFVFHNYRSRYLHGGPEHLVGTAGTDVLLGDLSPALLHTSYPRLEQLVKWVFPDNTTPTFDILTRRPAQPTQIPLSLTYNPGMLRMGIQQNHTGIAFAMRVRGIDGREVLP